MIADRSQFTLDQRRSAMDEEFEQRGLDLLPRDPSSHMMCDFVEALASGRDVPPAMLLRHPAIRRSRSWPGCAADLHRIHAGPQYDRREAAGAGRRLSEARSSSAIIAATGAFATARAVIGIVRNVNRWHVRSGSNADRPNFSIASTSCSVHRSGRDCCHRLPEQAGDLRHSLPGGR
jgi:hypothetical protein